MQRMKTVVTILVCLASFSFCADSKKLQVPVNNEEVESSSISRIEKEVFEDVNTYRESIGLPALKWMNAIKGQAEQHSDNMAKRKTGFGHEGFEERVNKLRKSITITGAAENVAYGKLSADAVTKGWLNSPGHKKNIEGNYTYTAVGISVDRQGYLFFTQIFIR
jgi:uncharacterized protein YkwD